MSILTQIKGWAYSGAVAGFPVIGIAVLDIRAARPSRRNASGYFFAYHGISSMEVRAVGPKGPLVTLSQYCNSARSSSPLADGAVDSQSTKRYHMNIKSALAHTISIPVRIFRFIASCIRLRSIGAAIWVDSLDQAARKYK